MPELRKDPIIGRWVIIATERAKRPNDFKPGKEAIIGNDLCPFCEGNEKLTPPEVDADRPSSNDRDISGWLTRTVPNKYPVLENVADLKKKSQGIFDMMEGVGQHEVIIESPSHEKQLADLNVEEIKRVVAVYKRRSIALGEDKRFKYVLIFKNYGLAAGASLEHSHTQLISLPIVPKRVIGELEGIQRYFEEKKKCVFCDSIEQERREQKRQICENDDFYAFCPFASRSPFEVCIIPKKHQHSFVAISESEIDSFSKILKDVLMRIKVLLNNPPYNFIIHTSPLNGETNELFHWHVELMPKLTKIAGFEWGTGFYINSTPPELASECLREVKV